MPGQNIGLVGTSGSGKSTIIQLINRFYDIEEGKGEILIDDINIKNYNLYELRKKIGLVSQEPSLFRASFLDNIRYGRLDANSEECLKAANEANIMKFFNQNKIDDIDENNNEETENDEKENLISGGERQRLCIARVFIKDPTILLLDEATSSLDKGAELEVQNSLDKLVNNRTCISVSHRLNTIEKCDQIFVMENGRIIEKGTHKELIVIIIVIIKGMLMLGKIKEVEKFLKILMMMMMMNNFVLFFYLSFYFFYLFSLKRIK